MIIRDRSKITSHNLFAKVPKSPDILQTECDLIFEPTHSGAGNFYYQYYYPDTGLPVLND